MAGITSQPNRETAARQWVGDYLDREHVLPGGARLDAAQFKGATAVKAVVGAAGAAQGATAVPVAALGGPIPKNTTLDFGGAKLAVLTADAAAGATSLTVRALPTALVSGDTASYNPDAPLVTVASGTVVGRTIAERDAGTGYGPAVDTDDEIFILVFDVTDAATNPDADLYRHGGVVKENYLPGWAGLTANLQAKVRSLYTCVKGGA